MSCKSESNRDSIQCKQLQQQQQRVSMPHWKHLPSRLFVPFLSLFISIFYLQSYRLLYYHHFDFISSPHYARACILYTHSAKVMRLFFRIWRKAMNNEKCCGLQSYLRAAKKLYHLFFVASFIAKFVPLRDHIFYSSKFSLSSDYTNHFLCCSLYCVFYSIQSTFRCFFFFSYFHFHKCRAYLRDVVETAHIFFKIMERFCHGRVVVQNKGRARRKAKPKSKAPTKSSQTKTSDGENVSWLRI